MSAEVRGDTSEDHDGERRIRRYHTHTHAGLIYLAVYPTAVQLWYISISSQRADCKCSGEGRGRWLRTPTSASTLSDNTVAIDHS